MRALMVALFFLLALIVGGQKHHRAGGKQPRYHHQIFHQQHQHKRIQDAVLATLSVATTFIEIKGAEPINATLSAP